MATTTFRRDYLLREIVTPASDARDYVGRATTATADYLGRDLVGTVWAISTVTAVGDYTQLSTGQVLKATVAGTTSGTTEPTAPGLGETVVDGTVTWEQVANS